jgi:hypothetical protein
VPVGFWKTLYVIFACGLVASAMSARWRMLAARRVDDWGRRSALIESHQRIAPWFGLMSVLLVGAFANLMAASLGLRLTTDSWLRWVNGIWFVSLIVIALVDLPASRELAHEARRAMSSGPSRAFDRALGRWRAGNSTLMLLSLLSIGLMVFRWRN